MAGVLRLLNKLVTKRVPITVAGQCRQCTTSKGNEKNWMSYGFDLKDEKADRTATHSIMFASITLCLVFGGFFYAYMPDYQMRDWAQRQAYLEVRRRELAGLPLLDPNLVDPATVTLPDDDELGDTEIII